MKKRLFAVLLTCVLAVSMVACGGEELTGELTYDVPADFTESSDGVYTAEGMFSNINVLSYPNDGSFGSASAEVLAAAIEEQLETEMGMDLDISIDSEENYEINGRDAMKYSISYDVMGTTFAQTQCIIEDGEELHFLTYTTIGEEGYEDKFAASLDSIRFE